MASTGKSAKNYTRILSSLDYDFPGLKQIPRATDAFMSGNLVDVYVAKRKKELAHRLPKVDPDKFRTNKYQLTDFQIDTVFLASLMAAGYSSVCEELVDLLQEEKVILAGGTAETTREGSILDDNEKMSVLIKGLVACAEAETSDKKIVQRVRIRKALGEDMLLKADFWLARKMFAKCFSYLKLQQPDDEIEKLRVELCCLIAYVGIYFEESKELGFELPGKCLTMARRLSSDKAWFMQKSVINMFIPNATNIYGLKNEWIRVKGDWVNMFTIATILHHVLSVKMARSLLDELRGLKREENREAYQTLLKSVEDKLTDALAYADEVQQYPAFIATTLRRGLFYDETGQHEKALEDYNALHAIAKKHSFKEALAMTMNRYGHYQSRRLNYVSALDYFVYQFDQATENHFAEIRADALQDIAFILLQEGHTWESEECYAKAYHTFRETKQPDTPNDLDEITWGMVAVSRGQNLWGRLAGHLRNGNRKNVRTYHRWKSSRRAIDPIVLGPENYRAHRRTDYDKQYETHPEKENRRLFEFEPELKSRQTIWFKQKGFRNVFDFINKSEKPRDFPEFIDELESLRDEYNHSFVEETKKRETIAEEDDEVWKKYRHKSIAPDIGWTSGFFGVHTSKKKKRGKSIKFLKSQDLRYNVSERMAALLDDLADVTSIAGGDGDDNLFAFDDESEDTELRRGRSVAFLKDKSSPTQNDADDLDEPPEELNWRLSV